MGENAVTEDRTSLAGKIALWCPPVIFIPGLICNIANIVILQSESYKSPPTWKQALTLLAVTDTFSLLFGLIPQWAGQIIHSDFGLDSIANNFSCKLLRTLDTFASHLLSWTTVLVAVDRVLAIGKPFQYQRLASVYKTTAAWLVLCITFGISDITVFYLFEVIDVVHHPLNDADFTIFPMGNASNVTTFKACITSPYNDTLWDFYMHFSIVITFLPFLIILPANLYVIREMYRSQKRLERTGSNKSASGGKIRSTGAMLVTSAFTYLCLTTPVHVFKMGVDEAWWSMLDVDFHHNPTMLLVYVSFVLLYYCNSSISFLLYCVSGRQFRRAAIEKLGCKTNVSFCTTT